MKQIDAYLSRKASAAWPSATVSKEEIPPDDHHGPRTHFVLERQGVEAVSLGYNFGRAREALYLLIKQAKGGA